MVFRKIPEFSFLNYFFHWRSERKWPQRKINFPVGKMTKATDLNQYSACFPIAKIAFLVFSFSALRLLLSEFQ